MLQKFDKFVKKEYNKKGQSKEGLNKYMKKFLRSSNIRKIVIISSIFFVILGISVLAGSAKLNSINIKFSKEE